MALVKKGAPAATTDHKATADAAAKSVDEINAETKAQAEEQAKRIAEEEAAQAAEDAAKAAADEQKAKEEAEAEATRQAEADAKAAEQKAKEEADAKAKAEAEAAEKAEVKAKEEADAAAKADAEAKAAEQAAKDAEQEKQSDNQGNEMKDENVVADQKVEETAQETAKSTEVAQVQTKEVAVAKPAVSTANVIETAADDGFGGIELGFGSFPVVKLVNEGVFNDSDENDLGKEFVATLQQSSEVFLYKQEGTDDGDVGYSYDGINLSAYNGDEEFKTVEELKAAWEVEGYETETKKYLEVVVAIDEEQEIEEVPEGLKDLLGEPVVLSLPPSSVKAFSGKVATLAMNKKPIKGSKMKFMVGKKRKNGNNTYFPWKFRLVK